MVPWQQASRLKWWTAYILGSFEHEGLLCTQDMELQRQVEEHSGVLNRRHMLSERFVERLRNGDFTNDIATAAEKAPRRRKVRAHLYLYGNMEQAAVVQTPLRLLPCNCCL